MKLSVERIQEKTQTLHAEEPVASFPVLSGMQAEGECVFTGPVTYDINAAREYDHLRVTGRVSVPLTLTCSRCLADYATAVDSSFTIMYRRGTPEEVAAEEETELTEQDLISVTYSGDEIDLSHEIEEQVAMEVPLKPLCSENCKGLCPTCGVDHNQGTCDCSLTPVNFKFSALKDFKVNK
ncbi:YceD family protein [Pelotalea chapellei]|uniref:DUF177 domain-containing protein n=1 Tax=Pelotalea chapellei TaxID=44671 RepID=A0ABS5U7G5_9BACT|nr:DUF177 domain-containing protein [Pelotalea chapellei]MBT1071605.1 DUF177 domain-containing protein [Pelotalea chapellei]